ncbi:MAG: hypothetical protein Q4G30_05445 [Actinomycetaceae bacterium]|nr:hypothetical protein [Actinomycetaceae bacterium]
MLDFLPPWLAPVIFVLLALVLLASRIPAPLSLGLPGALGLVFIAGPRGLLSAALEFMGAMSAYSFVGLALWFLAGAMFIESGLARRVFRAVFFLLGRPATEAQLDYWLALRHGLPGTLIALLIVATLPGASSTHATALWALPIVSLGLVVAVVYWKVQKPKTMRMQVSSLSKDSSKRGASQSFAVKASDDSETKPLQKSDAWIALMPLGIVAFVNVSLLLGTQASMTDLGGVNAFILGLFSLGALGSPVTWWPTCIERMLKELGFVAACVGGVALLASYLSAAGVFAVLHDFLASTQLTVLHIVFLAFTSTAIVGAFISAEAAALLVMSALTPLLTSMTQEIEVVTAAGNAVTILVIMGVVVGGLLARVLPPRSWPTPLSPAPVLGTLPVMLKK